MHMNGILKNTYVQDICVQVVIYYHILVFPCPTFLRTIVYVMSCQYTTSHKSLLRLP